MTDAVFAAIKARCEDDNPDYGTCSMARTDAKLLLLEVTRLRRRIGEMECGRLSPVSYRSPGR